MSSVTYLPTEIMGEIKGFMGLNCEKRCCGEDWSCMKDRKGCQSKSNLQFVCLSDINVKFRYVNAEMEEKAKTCEDTKEMLRDIEHTMWSCGTIAELKNKLAIGAIEEKDMKYVKVVKRVNYVNKGMYLCEDCMRTALIMPKEDRDIVLNQMANYLMTAEKMDKASADLKAFEDFNAVIFGKGKGGYLKIFEKHTMKKMDARFNAYKAILMDKYIRLHKMYLVNKRAEYRAKCRALDRLTKK